MESCHIKNSLRSNDAQLAERKLLLCSPLARRVCVRTHTFLLIPNNYIATDATGLYNGIKN